MGHQSTRVADDSEWREVQYINHFSVFMGYLLMAVRGLGFLVLTWTTVVLLGGFVSALSTKDFWFLTVITLVQTAGVFNASLTEKLNYIVPSMLVFLGIGVVKIDKANDWMNEAGAYTGNGTERALVAIAAIIKVLVAAAAALAQMLLFLIILCPLALLFVFGLFISTGLAVTRLIQRDYGDQASGDHMKSALDVLYSLAVLQGAVFSYRCILRRERHGLVNYVAKHYGLQPPSVMDMEETRKGCKKDPSFIKERNLITYAVELMQSTNCPDGYFSGLRILGGILDKKVGTLKLQGQDTLIKHLIGSPSSSHLLLKLLHTLDPRSQYGTVSRLHAARIVAILAGEIRLSQFPGTIHWIASLLDARQHQDDNDSAASAGEYSQLMEQGLLILRELATDEDNCKTISSTHGLLSKIMMPTASDLLHRVGHVEWIHDMVNMSLSVISQLAAAPEGTGKRLRRKILMNKEAIADMEKIFMCTDEFGCGNNPKSIILAIKIRKQLGINSASSMDTKRIGDLLNKLSDIFTTDHKDISICRSAAEALSLSLQSERTATAILESVESNDRVLHVLDKVLLDAEKVNYPYRLIAVEILKKLSVHCPKDGDHVTKLKKVMIDVMPKVLKKILIRESTEKAVQTEMAPPARDIENQKTIPQDIAQNISSSNGQQDDEQIEDKALVAALLSLCVVICDTFIFADQDLAHKLEEIDSEASFSLPRKLMKMIEKHSKPADDTVSQTSMKHTCKEMVGRQNLPTDNTITLEIMKHTCKMAMLMMKHNCRYNIEDMERLMKYLSDASKRMLCAEVLMIMASSGSDNGTEKPTGATDNVTEKPTGATDNVIEKPTGATDNGTEKTPDATLASLVKEAGNFLLLDQKKAE